MSPLLNGVYFWIWVGFSVLRIGVRDLHHCGRPVGAEAGRSICFADAGIAGENVGSAVFSAQNRPLGEYRKAIQCRRPGTAYNRIRQDPVVEGHIDTVVVLIKGHRLDGGLLRLENFRRRFHRFRHHSHHYHLHHCHLRS